MSTKRHMRLPSGEAPPPIRFKSKYSRFVRVMRVALPVGVVALGGLVAFWDQWIGGDLAMIVPEVGEVTMTADGRVQLASPRYVGQDDEGASYQIEAVNAWVDPNDPNKIELHKMVADFPDEDGRAITLEARTANYDRRRSRMELGEGVVLITSDGYRLQTDAATVRLEDGRVDTSTPVNGDGPEGTIRANRMRVRDNGDVIRFEGSVHALFR